MKISDAAQILNISGNITKELVKKAYRKSCSKYHPDKGGSNEMMQAVNQAYEVLKNFQGNIEVDDLGYSDLLNSALLEITALAGISIEVCGAWIWVTGDTKKYKEIFKKSGFYWASKKKAWYFRPSDWKSKSRGNFSLEEIREKHGSQSVFFRSKKTLPTSVNGS